MISTGLNNGSDVADAVHHHHGPRYVLSTKTKQVLEWKEGDGMKTNRRVMINNNNNNNNNTLSIPTIIHNELVRNEPSPHLPFNRLFPMMCQHCHHRPPLFMMMVMQPKDNEVSVQSQQEPQQLYCCNYVIGLDEPFIRIDRSMTPVSKEEHEIQLSIPRMTRTKTTMKDLEIPPHYNPHVLAVNTTRIESGHSLLVVVSANDHSLKTVHNTTTSTTTTSLDYVECAGELRLRPIVHHHHHQCVNIPLLECIVHSLPSDNNNTKCIVCELLLSLLYDEQQQQPQQQHCWKQSHFEPPQQPQQPQPQPQQQPQPQPQPQQQPQQQHVKTIMFFEIVSINLQTSFFAFPDIQVLENWNRFGMDGFSLYRCNAWEMKGRRERCLKDQKEEHDDDDEQQLEQ
ncbi:hypothetical protein FDP41_011444 [Naegleria fowleri]|uniref:Uncharacterized protein n=1 Tax=Naegleria fowleri TaxID=5763 RepID=A0A6A5C7Q1_NAEFO|nr:uncharacterized protein FDP41_011444 [Naegleria fowleri]KAF0982514.1 hypothetical protein FDP41_011444 [Naegleria fowleri]